MGTAVLALVFGTLARDAIGAETARPEPGLEAGFEFLRGSNAAAFGPGPAVRAVVDVSRTKLYIAQVAYGFSRHALVDSAFLYREWLELPDVTGHVDFHSLMAGAKVYPFARDFGDRPRHRVEPYLDSNVGALVAVGVMNLGAIGVSTRSVRGHFEMDLAGGVDLFVSERATVGAFFRTAVLPAIRVDDVGQGSLELFWMFQPALSLTVRL